MKAYQPIVCDLVRAAGAREVLDLPSGSGWLAKDMNAPEIAIDGIDLFDGRPEGYRNFMQADLDNGVPAPLGKYDMIVSCEGLEHIANPGLFLNTAREHLKPSGTLVITTPNTWHPSARMTYLLRGFFPGFPALAGKIKRGTHMHITPWSWPHLHLYLTLAGFTDVRLHSCLEDSKIRPHDRLFALPMKAYCRKHERKAETQETREFWKTAREAGAIYARRLVVSGKNPG